MTQNDQELDGMGEQRRPGRADAGQADGTADESGELPTGVDVGDGTGRMDMARQANAGRQSGSLGTRSRTDRSDVPNVPGVGLAGSINTGDVTGAGNQADADQEGANIQP